MSSVTFACFTCRTAQRRSDRPRVLPCKKCHEPMAFLGMKIPVPAASKRKDWQKLEESYHAAARAALQVQARSQVERIHDLEREIHRLEALPENPGRATAIKELRKQLGRARA
jgi:hypothetical protein